MSVSPERCALLLFAAGCSVSGTGVALTVEHAGLTVDDLLVVATFDGQSQPQSARPPAPVQLPQTILAQLPDRDTSVTFDVSALLGGAVVGHGSTDGAVAVRAHQIATAHVFLDAAGTLGGPHLDLGATADLAFASCPPWVDFCDDFEDPSGLTSKWNGKNIGPGAMPPFVEVALSPVPTLPMSARSLHAFSYGAASRTSAAIYKMLAPATGGAIGLRAWIYSDTPLDNFSTMLSIVGSQTPAPSAFSVGSADDPVGPKGVWVVTRPGFAGNDLYAKSNGQDIPFPTQRWTCVELYIVVDATVGSLRLFLDDAAQAAIDVQNIPTLPAGGFDELEAGLVGTAGLKTEQVWLDNVVFNRGSERIGCQ
jgi:hypothetical protein